MYRGLFLILAFLILSLPLLGQGFSFSEYYSPDLYRAHIQNWGAQKDTNGFIHFANGAGVLTFNGRSWKSNHVGLTGRATSVLLSKRGQLFISGENAFGFLAPDSGSNVSFRSLTNKFYTEEEDIAPHQDLHELNERIYFRHLYGINEIDGNEYYKHELSGDTLFGFSGNVGDSLLLGSRKGLQSFKKNRGFKYVAGSELLKGDVTWASFMIDSVNVMLGSRKNLLTIYDGENFEKFPTEADDYLLDNQLYDGEKINDSLYAIATLGGGIVFINNDGELEKIFNENTGLATNAVYDLYLDSEDILWISMLKGVQKLIVDDNITRYSTIAGLEDAVFGVAFSEDHIWVNTVLGLFVSELLEPENVIKFVAVPFGGITDIITWKNEAYIIGIDGVYKTTGNRIGEKVVNGNYLFLVEDSSSENLKFINQSRIVEFDGHNSTFTALNIIPRFEKALQHKEELFIMHSRDGIHEIVDGEAELIPIENNSRLKVYNDFGLIDSTIYAGVDSDGGSSIYKYDSVENKFIKSDFFARYPQYDTKQVFNFKQCSEVEAWFTVNMKLIRAYKINDQWEFQDSSYNLIKSPTNYEGLYTTTCADDGVWFGTATGLYHLKDANKANTTEFKTNITGIYLEQDSLVYGGFGESVKKLTFQYSDNQVRITYAAASYIKPELNVYSYILEGFDPAWSEWNSETQKDYTNLPEGNYMFKVRSKNAYGVAGLIDSIPIKILPPWYRTWWAYLLYTLAIAGLLYLAHKIRINQILKVYRIRNNIASDLHDEVSATLSSISYFAQAIKSDAIKGDKNRFVTLISDSAGDAKEKISDIVWAINPEHDEWRGFLSKCRRYASDLLESKEMKYSLKITEDIPGELDMQLRQHLWLIYKEMVTNSVRHSDAKQLDVIINHKKGKLNIVVQDNGKGMDVDKVKKGNGLVNINKRVDQINGDITLTSDASFGTRWVLQVSV
ncbi:MAG: triple tyrosine motif-containing protein [Balneolaceae bacterium]